MTENLGEVNFFVGQSQKISGTQKNLIVSNEDRQSHIINSIDWNPSEMYKFSWFSLNNHHNLKSDTSEFSFNGSYDGWSYLANHRSVDGEFISNNIDREELKLGLSKNFGNWKSIYSRTYDLNNNKEEVISETFGLGYTGTGYMFGNCLTVMLEYKNNGGVIDRDLIPENSIFLTFNFRNLGEYNWQPKEINKTLYKNLRY